MQPNIAYLSERVQNVSLVLKQYASNQLQNQHFSMNGILEQEVSCRMEIR